MCLLALVPASAQVVTVTGTPGTDITAALQAAISKATSGVGYAAGGEVIVPPGIYHVSATLEWPSNVPLRLVGSGTSVTTLTWDGSDLGQGKYAIDQQLPATYPIQLDDITLSGPRLHNAVGVAPAAMSGVHATDRADIENCNIGYFYGGIVIDGNHQVVKDCKLGSNYYGAYFIKPTDTTQADQMWDTCDFTGNYFAGVACDGYAVIGGDTFIRCHTGFEPYCFFREHGVVSVLWISGCQFLQCQFEGPGNADFWDTDGVSEIMQNSFNECGGYGSRYAGFAISGKPTSPSTYLGSGNFYGNVITAQGPTPGDITALSIQKNSWTLPGVTPIMEGLGATLAPPDLLAPPAYAAVGNRYPFGAQIVGNLVMDGDTEVKLMYAVTAISQYSPLELAANGLNECEIASGKNPVIGVALNSVPSTGGVVYVAKHGQVPVTCSTGANIAIGQPLVVPVNSGGLVTNVSVSTGQYIGTSAYYSSNGVVSTSLCIGQ
jgi:hypothetical protein